MYGLDKIMFSEILSVTLTLFAVIDILGSIPILIGLKQKMGFINAGTATLVSGALMILFFLFGEELLALLGLDISSFAIAGSLVIFFLALEMTLGIEIFKSEQGERSGTVVPIAFPLVAGSGTLTTIMSLKTTYHDYNILIGILINLLFVFTCIKGLSFLERILGKGGISVIRKFFGVILIAIAVKIFKDNVGL